MKLTAAAVAFGLFATPATVLAQNDLSCRDCDHIAPWFRGEGGFIGTVADDAEAVTFVASCGNVTITGKVEPGGGAVAQLFTYRNGLACDRDDGALEIAGLEDGGWFWVTDESSSAVGNLVALDLFDDKGAPKGEAAKITSAGAGVTMMAGRGAVFLKEAATGRVGILPTLLPEPPMDPAAVCGPRTNDDWPYGYDSQASSSCMLGGGRTKIRLTGPGSFGSSATITNGMVYRPNAGTVTVTADLWVDESGSYSTDEALTVFAGADDPTPEQTANYLAAVRKGWAGKTASALGPGSGTNWLTATFGASIAAAVGAPIVVAAGADPVAGVTLANNGSTPTNPDATTPNPVGQAVFTIGPNSSYCSKTNNNTAVLNVAAIDGANMIHPGVVRGRRAGLGSSRAVQGFAAIAQLRIVCPPRSSSANMGQELVPENPFPVDE
ncbi:MAG: hypothetical protein OXH70_03855 [Acidobacteria bacterium]|nr:hypothetical protein [Acidobacteriota bacterium]